MPINLTVNNQSKELDVDPEKASASTRNGVVTIRFPRVEEARSVRRIPIERGESGQKEQAA